MTRDRLFQYLRAHTPPTTVCARCEKPGIAYYRDALERPICVACVYGAKDTYDADQRAILRRLAALNEPTITYRSGGWGVGE